MNKYIQYVNEFQEWNEYWIYFVEYNLQKENNLTQNQIEQILDFVWRNKKKYKTIWIQSILEKSIKWHKKLIDNASSKDNEIAWKDYEIIKEWKNEGFKIIKLISKSCYAREWKLMSNCVSSYFWWSTEIYSLRDNKNLPHCTMEAQR
jgi:hypothetical protein